MRLVVAKIYIIGAYVFAEERICFEVFFPMYTQISKSKSNDTAEDSIEGLRHFDKNGNATSLLPSYAFC